ncbi:unnamed protein product [Linum tenue]|uniref:Uncharacterized protein n=1 Tax=Linum tenue TaxID=586396 RepID=A0AAV0R5Y6_9ROSI|nr:unnamed protein product [Linum tenue]
MDQERKNSNSSPKLALLEAEHEERDDEKIDKFFAIIKRLREARHGSSSSLRHMEAQRAKKAKKIQAPWTPSFQLEDFAGFAGLRTVEPIASSEREVCAQEEKHEIDLNLAL